MVQLNINNNSFFAHSKSHVNGYFRNLTATVIAMSKAREIAKESMVVLIMGNIIN